MANFGEDGTLVAPRAKLERRGDCRKGDRRTACSTPAPTLLLPQRLERLTHVAQASTELDHVHRSSSPPIHSTATPRSAPPKSYTLPSSKVSRDQPPALMWACRSMRRCGRGRCSTASSRGVQRCGHCCRPRRSPPLCRPWCPCITASSHASVSALKKASSALRCFSGGRSHLGHCDPRWRCSCGGP